jgi:aldose 1-epimerase
MAIEQSSFGVTPAGEKVDLYTLTNAKGLQVGIITWGGTCVFLKVPDRHGNLGDILLGHDTLKGYLTHDTSPYFNCLVGRNGNRIGKGTFSIDGVAYTLAINNGENHLHGGIVGFDQKIWTAKPITQDSAVCLELKYTSSDGEEGYPGTLAVTVVYRLTKANELVIDYMATTDKATLCNLTNHNYYNLAGAQRDCLDHQLTIDADQITPVDAGLIPTGAMIPVAGTPFDFTRPKAIGKNIAADDQQIKYGPGYDHNFVLNKTEPGELAKAAEVYEPTTGRIMEVWTTEPGIQFYSGNFLDGSVTGKGGKVYRKHDGFCLETQHYPDSPNKPQWPTTVLRPGETYKTTTAHKFSVR